MKADLRLEMVKRFPTNFRDIKLSKQFTKWCSFDLSYDMQCFLLHKEKLEPFHFISYFKTNIPPKYSPWFIEM